jgi:hypothetical protein
MTKAHITQHMVAIMATGKPADFLIEEPDIPALLKRLGIVEPKPTYPGRAKKRPGKKSNKAKRSPTKRIRKAIRH